MINRRQTSLRSFPAETVREIFHAKKRKHFHLVLEFFKAISLLIKFAVWNENEKKNVARQETSFGCCALIHESNLFIIDSLRSASLLHWAMKRRCETHETFQHVRKSAGSDDRRKFSLITAEGQEHETVIIKTGIVLVFVLYFLSLKRLGMWTETCRCWGHVNEIAHLNFPQTQPRTICRQIQSII